MVDGGHVNERGLIYFPICDRVHTRLWDTHLFLERYGAGIAVTTDVELKTNLTTQLDLCTLYAHAHSQDRDRITTLFH